MACSSILIGIFINKYCAGWITKTKLTGDYSVVYFVLKKKHNCQGSNKMYSTVKDLLSLLSLVECLLVEPHQFFPRKSESPSLSRCRSVLHVPLSILVGVIRVRGLSAVVHGGQDDEGGTQVRSRRS